MEYAHRRVIGWVVAACAAVAAGASTAATLNVCQAGCSYKTVQSAVDAAATSGDTIIVQPGRYVGNVTVAGKDLTIMGPNIASTSQVQLIGTGNGPVFTLGADTAGPPFHGVFIMYLTVTGGSHFGGTGEGGGIQVRDGSYLDLINANVIGNSAAAGGGISVNTPSGGQSAIISNCLVSTNTAYTGGGIYIAPHSNVFLSYNCVVANNLATGNAARGIPALGGGIYAGEGSEVALSEYTISNNSVTPAAACNANQSCTAAGGGVYALGQFAMFLTDINQNSVDNFYGAALGGGLYVAVNPTQQFSDSTISHNSVFAPGALATGGGLFAVSADPLVSWTIDGDYIVGNRAASAGGVQNVGKLSLQNGTTIAGNTNAQCLGGKGCPAN